MREAVMVDYIAKIKPINADKIETQAHRIATFSEMGTFPWISRWETSSCSDANAGRES